MAVTQQINHSTLTDQDTYLVYLTERGIKERYGDKSSAQLKEVYLPRAMHELEIIMKKGFTDYFLILADLIIFCRNNDIPVGVGRGSSAGSLVAYCLGITEVDPIRFDLLFERFLNMERFEYPDIDTDVCWSRRQEVIQYLAEKYGDDKVAQIISFGTLSPKTSIQDIGRVLKISHTDVEELKKLVPESEKVTLEDCLESQAFIDKLKEIDKLDSRFLPALVQLEGLHRHASIHAGGVIIATKPINEIAPVYRPIGAKHEDVRPVVQFEMKEAESVGLLKMDLLGLRTVTLVDWAEKDIRKHTNPDFYTRKMSLEEQPAFDIINAGDTDGIFQLEGNGITRFAQSFNVTSFDDIVALIALYRPGTLDSGMADRYIKRKNGEEPVSYPHPDLEWILKDTYGVMVYQEQIMQIAGVMCGYSMGKADGLRHAVGKKDFAKIDKELGLFTEYALSPDHGKQAYDAELVTTMVDLIRTFGRYGFNKSHAVSYAYLTYWTAYLKAVHPVCFYVARMNTSNDNKVPAIIRQALAHKVELLPPDVNQSGLNFSIDQDMNVRFGLSNIKGLGGSYVSKVLADRDTNGGYNTFFQFCFRNPSLPVNTKGFMVQSGAFDVIEDDRQKLLFNIKDRNIVAKKRDYAKYATIDAEYFRARQMNLIQELQPLDLGQMEYDILGFYVTADPMIIVQEAIEMAGGVVGKPIDRFTSGSTAIIGGQVMAMKNHKTKTKGEQMAFLSIDDGIEKYDVTIFPSTYNQVAKWLRSGIYVQVTVKAGNYNDRISFSANSIEVIDLDARSGDIIFDLRDKDDLSIMILSRWLDSLNEGGSRIKFIYKDKEGYEYKLLHNKAVHLDRTILDQIKPVLKVKYGGR